MTPTYETLDPICRSGLTSSLNSTTGLYDQQLLDGRWQPTGLVTPTEDLTSTAICLIGVTRDGMEPTGIGLDVSLTLKALHERYRQLAYRGGFGMVVWANAVTDGPDFADLSRTCDRPLAVIDRHLAAITTMETAWLASGLAHEVKRGAGPEVESLLIEVANELSERRFQENTNLMAHASAGIDDRQVRLRRWVANFADQIYSVQALAFTSLVTATDRYLRVADRLADRLVAMQGELGQWWWHYDARNGHSPQPYAVYSVHQHGMAPMALHALRHAGGSDHTSAIELSRRWLVDNELGLSMIDHNEPTIWRSVERDEGRVTSSVRKVASLIGREMPEPESVAGSLVLNRETRPYEWAWCLYAGAIDRGHRAGNHVV